MLHLVVLFPNKRHISLPSPNSHKDRRTVNEELEIAIIQALGGTPDNTLHLVVSFSE